MTRTTTRALFTAATAALLALAPLTPAAAQGAGGSSTGSGSAIKSATVMLYNEGLQAAKKGNWQKAYEAFSAAWRIQQHPQIALNLGRAALKTGRPLEAAEHLSFFMRETKMEVDNQDRAVVQKLLLEAQQEIGTLIIKVNRPGAEVLVDGQVVGQAPLSREVFVDPGSHTVEARMGAERAEPITVELTAGQGRQVGLVLGEGRRQAPEDDGAKAEQGKGEKVETGGGSLSIFGDPDPKYLIAGGVTVGVGLVSGIVFTALANNDMSKVMELDPNDECRDDFRPLNPSGCPDAHSTRERAMAFSNIAFWSFVGAGTAGLGTLVYAVVAPKRKSSDIGTQVIPVATAAGGGLTVTGRW